MSLCPSARCGCAFDSATLDIARASDGRITIDLPDAYSDAWPIFTFLDTAERDAEIPSPEEGMECWTRTDNRKYRCDVAGSWRLVAARGTYTPTLAVWGAGAATLTGRYLVTEGWCIFGAVCVLAGDTTTVGQPTLSLPPFAPLSDVHTGNANRGHARGTYSDATGGTYSGAAFITTVAVPLVWTTSAAHAADANLSATVPFTWAVNDSLEVRGGYEIA